MSDKVSAKAYPHRFSDNITQLQSFAIISTVVLIALVSLFFYLDPKTIPLTLSIPVTLTVFGLLFIIGSMLFAFGSKKLELYDRSRPCVYLYSRNHGNQFIEVIVSNVGRGDALSLSIELVRPSLDPSRISEVATKGDYLLTLEILGAGKEVQQLLRTEPTGRLLLKYQNEDGLCYSNIFPINSVEQIREAVPNLESFDGTDQPYDWGGVDTRTLR